MAGLPGEVCQALRGLVGALRPRLLVLEVAVLRALPGAVLLRLLMLRRLRPLPRRLLPTVYSPNPVPLPMLRLLLSLQRILQMLLDPVLVLLVVSLGEFQETQPSWRALWVPTGEDRMHPGSCKM